MFTMNIPKYLWGDVLTSAYLINRLPSRPLKFNNPLFVLTKHYPQVFKPHDIPLKTFGCTIFVHLHNQGQSKLNPKAVKTVFVEYSPTKKGYRCYIVLELGKFMSCMMLFSLKIHLISHPLRFRGRTRVNLAFGMFSTYLY